MSEYPNDVETQSFVDEPLSGGGWGSAPIVEPAHDEHGEIIDAEVVDETTPPDVLSSELELLPLTFAQNGERAVELFRDPEAVRDLTHRARTSLLERVRGLAARARAQRPDGRPTSATLAPEITLMADAHDTLIALRDVFAAGAAETRSISGEIALELADDPRKSSSVRVGDRHGGDVKLSRTVETTMRVDDAEIIDVIVAHVLSSLDMASIPKGSRSHVAVNAGVAVRKALSKYRELAASHTFKSTTLDAYVRELENDEQDALAIRLGHAYGRVSTGRESVKVERVAPKGAQS